MKRLAIIALLCASFWAMSAAASAQTAFPCGAFQLHSNGTLVAGKTVKVTDSKGETVRLKSGRIILPRVPISGVDVYSIYQQSCGG